MSILRFIIIGLISLQCSVTAMAKSKKKSNSLRTEMDFRGKNVRGKYNNMGVARAIVEDEKKLPYLLSIRLNFKDRIKKETNRE